MRMRDLTLVLPGLLVLLTTSGQVLAQTRAVQVTPHLTPLTKLTQSAQLVNGSDTVLPALSFATPEGLFSILPNGEARQPLMEKADSPFFSIAWTADREKVAVVRNFSQVSVIRPDQSNSAVIFESDCVRPPTLDLTWQTDDETLIIQELCDPPVSGSPGSQNIFVAQPAGAVEALSNLPDTLQSGLYLSPGGTAAAYVANDHIYVLGTDGSAPRQVTQSPGVYGAAGSPLAWSPDGEQLAFFEGNYPFQRINIINTDGTGLQQLTPDPDFQIYRSRLAWSPDGSKLAFYQPSNPPDSNQEVIRLIDLASGDIETLTRPGFYDALSWSPDGQQLAFASGSQFERQAMFVYDLASGDFTVLTPEPFQNVLTSAWSPNGDWIAFTATPVGDELGTQILYTVRPDASGLTVLTSPSEYVYPFAWIPQP
jgi:hypothetical protein